MFKYTYLISKQFSVNIYKYSVDRWQNMYTKELSQGKILYNLSLVNICFVYLFYIFLSIYVGHVKVLPV